MIHFFSKILHEIIEENLKPWIEKIIITEGKRLGEINYIFCDDEYLLKINQDFLATRLLYRHHYFRPSSWKNHFRRDFCIFAAN